MAKIFFDDMYQSQVLLRYMLYSCVYACMQSNSVRTSSKVSNKLYPNKRVALWAQCMVKGKGNYFNDENAMVVFKFKLELKFRNNKITLCYNRELPHMFALKYINLNLKIITRRGPVIGTLSFLSYLKHVCSALWRHFVQAFEIALFVIRSFQKL